MKILVTSDKWRMTRTDSFGKKLVTRHSSLVAGFTMIEIAISLAIIGIALVAIIGVLPLGMNVQRDNREQTIINQDATVFIEAIRNGTRGLDDLTNYIYAITNSWAELDATHKITASGINGYDYSTATIAPGYFVPAGTFTWPVKTIAIHSGTNIVGLLSTPEFTDVNGKPLSDVLFGRSFGNNYYSNHIIAYVHSMSGLASEKPPQDNALLRENAFSYRLFCVNSGLITNSLGSSVPTNLLQHLHDLRLTFLFPQFPNGNVGNGRITFRTLVAGQVVQDTNNNTLYFYQPQSFTNTP